MNTLSPLQMNKAQFRAWVAQKLRKASRLYDEFDVEGAARIVGTVASYEERRTIAQDSSSALLLACENWLDGVGEFPSVNCMLFFLTC